MKRSWIPLALVLGLILSVAVYAASATARRTAPGPGATAGIEAARTLSTITGVAISPLLGVGTVGAWEYFSTPSEKRRSLHWYAEPLFWVPALLLVVVVFVKDTAGTALPSALKKPLDAAELVENKISGLVAAGAFVPLIVQLLPSKSGWLEAGLGGGSGFLGLIDAGALANLLLTPFAMIAFGLVWLVAHTIQVLILLSPFTTVDAALKAARTALLGLVAGSSLADPLVGGAIAAVVMVAAYFLAGWSFRLMVFGQVCVWDLLTLRRTRFAPEPDGNWMFTARELEGAPIRTYGRLWKSADGALRFEYRPWLVLRPRSFSVDRESLVVGRGLFHPEILRVAGGLEEEAERRFTLPPRYRTHEEELRGIYAFSEVRDVGMLKGFKAIRDWLFSTAGTEPLLSHAAGGGRPV